MCNGMSSKECIFTGKKVLPNSNVQWNVFKGVYFYWKKSTPQFKIELISGENFFPCGSKFFPGKYYSGSTFFPGNYYSGSNFFRGVIIYGYTGKAGNYNKDIGLDRSVVMSKLPTVPDSNYHAVMDNFFTSPSLLRVLKVSGIATTGKVGANRTKKAPFPAVDDMKKQARGISDVVNDKKFNVTLVCWEDNKVVTVASTLYGKEPMKRALCYIKDQGGRVEIDQANAISFHNKTMGRVDRIDQNTDAYMINIDNKKWWWPLFRFCVDLAVNNAFQLYRLQPLNQETKTT